MLDRGPGTEIHLTEVEDLHQDLKAAPWLGMQTTNKPGGGRFQTKHVRELSEIGLVGSGIPRCRTFRLPVGDGFKYFLFSPRKLRKMIQFDYDDPI